MRIAPSQRGQAKASMPHARRKSVAHASRRERATSSGPDRFTRGVGTAWASRYWRKCAAKERPSASRVRRVHWLHACPAPARRSPSGRLLNVHLPASSSAASPATDLWCGRCPSDTPPRFISRGTRSGRVVAHAGRAARVRSASRSRARSTPSARATGARRSRSCCSTPRWSTTHAPRSTGRSWRCVDHAIDDRDPRARPFAELHRQLLDDESSPALEEVVCVAVSRIRRPVCAHSRIGFQAVCSERCGRARSRNARRAARRDHRAR